MAKDKLWLCVEHGEKFYIESESKASANDDASMWGASVICEVPRKYAKTNPNEVLTKIFK
jgi:hypothetical protein